MGLDTVEEGCKSSLRGGSARDRIRVSAGSRASSVPPKTNLGLFQRRSRTLRTQRECSYLLSINTAYCALTLSQAVCINCDSSQQLVDANNIVVSILQVRKLRLREVRLISLRGGARKQKSWDLNSDLYYSKA